MGGEREGVDGPTEQAQTNLLLQLSYGPASSIYDHFIIWPSSVTLTFELRKQMFRRALFQLEHNNCAKLFWNPCINVPVMARQAQFMTILIFIWPLWLWPSTYLKKMLQMALFLLKDNNSAKFILKSVHKCTSYGPDEFNIWPFWPLFDPCDLDLQPTWKNVSNGACPLRATTAKLFWNPCINVQVMARTSSIHVYDHSDLYLTSVTTFNLPKKNVSNDTSPLKGNNCAKLFWNPCIIVQVMVQTNPDGCGQKTPTDTHTPNKIVTMYVSLTSKQARQ